MKHPTKYAPSSPATISDEAILHACAAAATAEVDYALKALFAGQLLIEKRHALARSCHDGKSFHKHDGTKPEAAQFGKWLESVGIASRTAYRWIDCTERVMRHHLGLTMGDDLPVALEIEGVALPLSEVLMLPEAQLPAQARKLHQDVFDFMQDKSLGEAARAAFGGDSAASRITRAANGKSKGGTHDADDRRDWPKFVGVTLKTLNSHVSHWDSMSAVQRAEITSGLVALCTGGEYKPAHTRSPIQFGLWPQDLCEAMAEGLRLRMKRGPRTEDRGPRT